MRTKQSSSYSSIVKLKRKLIGNWYIPSRATQWPLEVPRPHLGLTTDICNMHKAHPHMEEGHQQWGRKAEWDFSHLPTGLNCIALHSPQITTSYALHSAEVTINIALNSPQLTISHAFPLHTHLKSRRWGKRRRPVWWRLPFSIRIWSSD